MHTSSWLLTLLLASLHKFAARAEDLRTTCASSTVTEGERAVITYHLRPDIDYSTSLLYIRRDQEPGHILICDGTCNVKNGHFRSAGIMGTTLTLEAPAVTPEEQGRYYLFAVVDGQQQTPCACNLTVVAKAAVPPPAEDGTDNTMVVGIVVGGLVLITIGVGLLLYVLVIRKRKKSYNPQKTSVKKDEEILTNGNGITAGDCDDRTKVSEAERETATLLTDVTSDSPPLLSPSPPPDTGVTFTPLGPLENVHGSDYGTDVRFSAYGVRDSHATSQDSSVDAAPKESTLDERPTSLMADRGTIDTVIFLINSLRAIATKLREVIRQHPTKKGVGLEDVFKSVREQNLSSETHIKWESLRRKIARRVNLQLSAEDLKETATKLLEGAFLRAMLASELSKKFETFRHETSMCRAETDKTFATPAADQDFNVVCLCLSLSDMVDMSVRMRNEWNRPITNVLERVATELEWQTKYFESHQRGVW